MDSELLKKLEALDNAATPVRWSWEYVYELVDSVTWRDKHTDSDERKDPPDVAVLMEARNSLPILLAEIRRLQGDQWITKGMPDEANPVLITTESGEVRVAVCREERFYAIPGYWSIEVIAWKPLPVGYKR